MKVGKLITYRNATIKRSPQISYSLYTLLKICGYIGQKQRIALQMVQKNLKN